jgi:hypothetical protein
MMGTGMPCTRLIAQNRGTNYSNVLAFKHLCDSSHIFVRNNIESSCRAPPQVITSRYEPLHLPRIALDALPLGLREVIELRAYVGDRCDSLDFWEERYITLCATWL